MPLIKKHYLYTMDYTGEVNRGIPTGGAVWAADHPQASEGDGGNDRGSGVGVSARVESLRSKLSLRLITVITVKIAYWGCILFAFVLSCIRLVCPYRGSIPSSG